MQPTPRAPTRDDLLDLWSRIVPDELFRAMVGDPSEAIFRALAAEHATLGAQGDRGISARYVLPSAIQRYSPATLGAPATGQVVVERRGPSDFPLLVQPGALVFTTPRGERLYRSTGSYLWWPGETAAKTIDLVCEVPGFVGNLDFQSNPDGTLDLDLLALASPVPRGNTDATVPAPGVLRDTGYPDVLSPEHVAQYLQITAGAPDNLGIWRVTGHQWPQAEIPAGSGLYPRQVTLDDQRWLRSPEPVLFDQGLATFTDYYAQAWTGGPVPLFGVVPSVGDTFYFSSAEPFDGLVIDLIGGEGDWGVAWEYWDGAVWTALPDLADPTLGWRVPGLSQASWTVPGDWAPLVSALSGIQWYYIRVRLDSLVAVTTAPTFARVATITTSPVVLDTGVIWRILDYGEDLGLTITAIPQAPTGGRDNDLYVLGDNRGVYRQAGEDQETFRQRVARLADVVSPNAIQRIVNRALEPLGLTGLAVDVSSQDGAGVLQYPGMFLDTPVSSLPIVSALDLYGPGDLFPEIPGMLPLEADEAWGWFVVLVPWSGDGEFGGFLDVDFLDTLFMDGWPVTYYSTLAGLVGQIDVAKAGGVGWTIVRDLSVTP